MNHLRIGLLVCAATIVLAGCPDPLAGNGDGDYVSPNVGTLVYVPAGTFQRDAASANLTEITRPFRIGRYEVTRAQFLAVMGHDPSFAESTGMSDPVQFVNWYQAIAFCNRLSIMEGLTPVYAVSGVDFATFEFTTIPSGSPSANWDAATADWSANGYRLPTSMEWMWAAMGADTADPGQVNITGYTKAFAGSTGTNDIDDYAWYSGNSGDSTRPVGGKLPNELGLYDMSGNVYDWCWDWDSDPADLPDGTLVDYRGAQSGEWRIRRGGSWGDWLDRAALGSIPSSVPWGSNGHLGVRVVRN